MAYKHLFNSGSHSALYHQFRPNYPRHVHEYIIGYLRQKVAPPYSLAVDVGCGTGNSTRPLVEYFEHVVGCDISESQITQAQAAETNSKISFKVASFNCLPAANGSAEMVLSSLAAHWFEPIEDFYKEVNRVLCPGGCLVIYCYSNPEFDVQHKDKDEMSKLIEKFQDNDLFKPYVTSKRLDIINGYKCFNLPYLEQLRNDEFDIKWRTKLSDFLKYCRTWSFVQKYYEANPEKPDLMLQLQSWLQKYLGDDQPEKCEVFIRYPVHILITRKPPLSFG